MTQDTISSQVQDFYERFPYPGYGNHGGYFERFVQSYLDQHQPETVLEVGCGTGGVTLDIARLNPDTRITAWDITERSIQIAQDQAIKANLTNVSFQHRDILEAPVDCKQFDFVYSHGVLHCVADFELGLRCVCQLLKPAAFGYIWLYVRAGRGPIHNLRQRLAVFEKQSPMTYEERLEIARRLLRPASNPVPKLAIRTLNPVSVLRRKLRAKRMNKLASANSIPEPESHDSDLPSREEIIFQDTFLHPFDQDFTIAELYDAFDAADIPIQKFVEAKNENWPNANALGIGVDLVSRLSNMPIRDRDTFIEQTISPGGAGFLIQRRP